MAQGLMENGQAVGRFQYRAGDTETNPEEGRRQECCQGLGQDAQYTTPAPRAHWPLVDGLPRQKAL